MSEGLFVIGFNKNPKKIKVIRLSEGEYSDDNVQKVVKTNSFTTFTTHQDYGYEEYLTIKVGKIDGEYYLDVMSFEWDVAAVLNINLRDEMQFLYDIEAGGMSTSQVPLWKNREKARSKSGATKYVASRLSEIFGYNWSKEDVAELKDYAKRYDVPLNIDMFTEFEKIFKTEHPNWNSSDGRCPW